MVRNEFQNEVVIQSQIEAVQGDFMIAKDIIFRGTAFTCLFRGLPYSAHQLKLWMFASDVIPRMHVPVLIVSRLR
jgi:hypothetical protein